MKERFALKSDGGHWFSHLAVCWKASRGSDCMFDDRAAAKAWHVRLNALSLYTFAFTVVRIVTLSHEEAKRKATAEELRSLAEILKGVDGVRGAQWCLRRANELWPAKVKS